MYGCCLYYLHLYMDFLLLSSRQLLAASKALCRSWGSSSLRIWTPSPLPHLDPPSKQNRPPSRGPNRLKSFKFQLWNNLGGNPKVSENRRFCTWILTGIGDFETVLRFGHVIRCAEKCCPSSNWAVTRTCHRMRFSRFSNARAMMSVFKMMARVWDSRSRVNPASQPKYSSKAMLPLVGGLRSQSRRSFHNCKVRESVREIGKFVL